MWMFDFVQTFPMEVDSVWSCKLTGSAALFLVNRYGFLMYQILSIIVIIRGTLSGHSWVLFTTFWFLKSCWYIMFRCNSINMIMCFLGVLLTANTGCECDDPRRVREWWWRLHRSVLFAFRVYAIYDRSKTILVVTGLLVISRLAFDITVSHFGPLTTEILTLYFSANNLYLWTLYAQHYHL